MGSAVVTRGPVTQKNKRVLGLFMLIHAFQMQYGFPFWIPFFAESRWVVGSQPGKAEAISTAKSHKNVSGAAECFSGYKNRLLPQFFDSYFQ